MLCRLCIGECGDTPIELFDGDGRKNNIYNVVAKYFDEQFKKMESVKNEIFDAETESQQKCTERVICSTCWQHINDFHQWQLRVLAAQEQHEENLKQFSHNFVDSVKLEVEVDIIEADVFAEPFATLADDLSAASEFEEDPVGVSGRKSNVTLEKIAEIDNVKEDSGANEKSSEDDDDDKPLLKRIKECRRKTGTIITRKVSKTKLSRVGVRKRKDTIANTDGGKVDVQPAKRNEKGKQRVSKTQEYDEFIATNFKEQLPCELCNQMSSNFTELHAHFRSAHNIENGYVICCKHKYSQRFHLIEHLRLHLNPQQYQCTECGKCSANTWSLVTHMKLMHGTEPQERPFECEVCHKRFAKETVLRTHMEVHAEGNKDHVCKECGKGFVLESRLNIHIRNVHSTEYQSVCEQCGKSFRGRYALKYHLLEHSDTGKRKWPCDKCDAELHSKSSLKRHIRLAHHDGTTAYVCSECGKVTLTEDALRNHKRYVHERERKHKCNICEKAFKTPKHLREHMTTHTGEDLYQCPHCPRTFKVSANMHHHRKRKHPIEWAEKNKQRAAQSNRVDFSRVLNKVVL